MSRKILLSFLGTNDYVECNYYPEGKPDQLISEVKYVQEAIIPLFCSDFSTEDCFYFFLTDKAKKANWNDDGLWNKHTKKNDKPNKGLHSRLNGMNLSAEIKSRKIPDGFGIDEVWEIFECIFSCIEEEDEVYLDITHAFRFFPMLGLSLLNYAEALKKITVKGIYYGAFEKLGVAPEVKELPVEKRNAPILDLLSLSELQDWTNAAFDFLDYGKVSKMVRMTNKEIKPILAKTKGEDELAKNLRGVSKEMEKMAKCLATNRGKAIFKEVHFDEMKNSLEKIAGLDNFIKPLVPLIDKVQDKINSFKYNDPLHWLHAAKWSYRHGMYQQAITQLQEGILTWLCLKLSDEDNFFSWEKKEPRGVLSYVLNSVAIGRDLSVVTEDEIERDRIVWLGEHPLILSLAKPYASITDLRNDINHGGYTDPNPAKTFLNKLQARIDEVEENIENL